MMTEKEIKTKIKNKYPRRTNNHSFTVIVSHEEKRVVVVGFPDTCLIHKKMFEIPDDYSLEIYDQVSGIYE